MSDLSHSEIVADPRTADVAEYLEETTEQVADQVEQAAAQQGIDTDTELDVVEENVETAREFEAMIDELSDESDSDDGYDW